MNFVFMRDSLVIFPLIVVVYEFLFSVLDIFPVGLESGIEDGTNCMGVACVVV